MLVPPPLLSEEHPASVPSNSQQAKMQFVAKMQTALPMVVHPVRQNSDYITSHAQTTRAVCSNMQRIPESTSVSLPRSPSLFVHRPARSLSRRRERSAEKQSVARFQSRVPARTPIPLIIKYDRGRGYHRRYHKSYIRPCVRSLARRTRSRGRQTRERDAMLPACVRAHSHVHPYCQSIRALRARELDN